MRSALEKIEKNKVALEIEIDVEEVEESLAQAYRTVVKKVNVPGFRKGHVPRPILEARLGKKALYEEALDILLPQAYQKAIIEQDLVPIDQPKIDVEQFEQGKPLKFKATVEVIPEVNLGEYKGITAVMPEVKVGDNEVEEQLKVLQERHASLVDSDEDQVNDGNVIVVDVNATVDGKAQPRLGGEAHVLEIGSGKFIPGFEGELLGTKLGEEKEFTLNLPSLFQYADLEGKVANFKVKVTSIKRKEVSLIDDEFARDVSEYSTLDELKEHLRNKLDEMGHINAKRIFTERVVAKLVEQAEVEIPPVLVNRQVEEETQQFVSRLAYQRLNLDDYLKMTDKGLEDLRTDLTRRSEDIVKQNLVFGAVAKLEGIKVTPEQLDSEVNDLAAQYGVEAVKLRHDLKEKGKLDAVEQGLLADKVQNFLAEQAVEVPGEEVQTEVVEPVELQETVQQDLAKNEE